MLNPVALLNPGTVLNPGTALTLVGGGAPGYRGTGPSGAGGVRLPGPRAVRHGGGGGVLGANRRDRATTCGRRWELVDLLRDGVPGLQRQTGQHCRRPGHSGGEAQRAAPPAGTALGQWRRRTERGDGRWLVCGGGFVDGQVDGGTPGVGSLLGQGD